MCARMDMESCLSKIKELSQELVQKQILGNVDEIIDKLFSEVSCLDSQNAVKIQEPQVEESAINLWNWAVTEHVGSAINGEQRAKVRHVACRLAYACETSDPKEGAIRRQILMAIKTGRSWLDTKKPASADVFFSLAVKNLELLYGRLKTRSDGQSDLNIPKGDVEKDLFRVHSYQAESVALAMEPPAHFPSLCKKALRIALSLHRKRPDSDILRCSQCLHSLIQLSLPTGVLEVESRVLEEVWGYYEEALLIISSAHGEFPEVEILWLLTRAWNTGILLYSLAQYTEAEKWCGLGMSFLRHLGSLQASYESQMSGLYTEVLDRLDKAKTSLVTEA
ncbi:UNVERIFIED_CONTAM: hypothetical protein FKN15_058582 [Acipenser sinensis]